MNMDDEKGVIGSEEDDERTVFGGSAPVSRFSTTRGRPGIMKRRPWAVKWNNDVENAAGKNNSLTNLVHRGSTVSLAFKIMTQTLMSSFVQQNRHKRVQQEKTIEELKKGERVNVKISPMYIFLLRDGKYPTLRFLMVRTRLIPQQEPSSPFIPRPTSNTRLRSLIVSAIVIRDSERQQMHRCWFRACSILVSTCPLCQK